MTFGFITKEREGSYHNL